MKMKAIKEGHTKKGGQNSAPLSSRPSTSVGATSPVMKSEKSPIKKVQRPQEWPEPPPKETKKEGVKHDQDKDPLHLLPTEALREISKVLKFGAKKYDLWNWKRGMKWTRLQRAATGHIFDWAERKGPDEESGLSHLAHAGCCILFLLTFELLDLGEDDRWKSED